MTSIVLVPWGLTDWGAAGRLATRTPLPLSEAGLEQAVQWANELAGRELAAVYCGNESTSRETAVVLAERAEVRLRLLPGLAEVDLGLWDGLTSAQVESRFPRIYRRWIDDPAAVCPPDGECIATAADRIRQAVEQIVRKHQGATVAIVLGPIALSLARSHLEHGEPSRMHRLKATEPVWYRLGDGLVQAVPSLST